jgi:hypothetical protein
VVDQARDAQPDRLDVAGSRLAHLAHRVDERRDHAALIELGHVPAGAVVHLEIGIDRPCERFGPAEIDPDDAGRCHGRPL